MKTSKIFTILLGFIFCISLASATYACSVFALKGKIETVYGSHLDRGYSWESYFMTNNKNIKKIALVSKNEKPVKWTSKYNSITFAGSGKGFPVSGMNEKGLVVITLTAHGTKYPKPDNRPSISVIQWVQYQLDESATVQDVINSNKKIRISTKSLLPQHIIVGDRDGNTAIIEFINGKEVVYQGKDLPIPLATNSFYEQSVKTFNTYNKTHKNVNIKNIINAPIHNKKAYSLRRFIIGAYMLKRYKNSEPLIGYAVKTLKALFNKEYHTRMSYVYDPVHLKIYYYTYKNPKLKEISFNDFNFKNNKKSYMINANKNFKDVKNVIQPFNQKINQQLAYYNLRYENIPIKALTGRGEYAEQIHKMNFNK